MDSPLTAPFGRVARRLLGLALAATTALWAGAAAALDNPPEPTTPGGVVALLKWCWTLKDATRYRDLFTSDYLFIPQAPDIPWTRGDELNAAGRLFGSGSGAQPGAATITLDWLGSPPPAPGTAYLPGEPYPAYQQFIGIASIAVTRTDNSVVTGQGPTMFHLIRGDLASIPQEMRDRGIGPDPNRWYIQKWEDTPAPDLGIDHAPLVSAPESLVMHVGRTVTLDVTVNDMDYDPVASLTAAGVPVTEGSFVPSADHLSGRLTWSPTASEVGTFVVTFTASNRLSDAVTTRIIMSQGLPPVAVLTVSPTNVLPYNRVTLDAAGSQDPDGHITSFHFDFGDGTSLDTQFATVNHEYARGGRFTPSVRVTDNDGQTAAATGPTVNVDLPPIAFISADVTRGLVPLTVTFDPSGSRDPDGTITSYQMSFGDGSASPVTATSSAVTHTYTYAGTFNARLFVTDNDGAVTQMAILITSFLTDRPPFVQGPDAVSVHAGKTMVFAVSALDPDNQPAAIDVSGLPPGATFTKSANTGTFQWTPTVGDQGSRSVTFTASNTLSSSKVVTLTVLPPNLLPIASLTVTPTNGIEPLQVHLSAAASHDDDGQIVRYLFRCGDGTVLVNTTPELDHTYAGGHWQPSVTVMDDAGDEVTATADVQVVPVANLARNPSFEADTRYWNSYAGSVLERIQDGHDGSFGLQVTGPPVINPAAVSFGVNDSPDNIRWTVAAGIHYRYTAWVRSPSSHGRAVLRVTEYLIATAAKLGVVTSSPVTLSPDWQQLTVDYTTTAANSTLDFQVRDFPLVGSEVFITDDIAVRNVTAVGAGTGMAAWYDGEHDPVAMEARLTPSPMHGSGTLRFMTTARGSLRVDLLDLAGRRVRTLMSQSDAPAGLYELPVIRLGDDGRRLGAGVYFWRVAGREGTKTGRFVMLQ
jgi:PKD repeat protein